jgi:hypothetical protein
VRIRSIKPSVFKDAKLWDLGQSTGMPILQAFEGLWCAADREGRFKWEPRELKIDILPYWDGDFSRVLDALMTRGFVVKYAFEGREYGLVRTFKAHQIVNNREAESSLPEPTDNLIILPTSTCDPRVDHASTTPLVPALAEGKGTGREQEQEHISVGVTADMWHVFNRWVEIWGKKLPATKFTPKRKRVVRDRLKRYPLADLVDAVEGAHLSPHHLGRNDSGEVYDELELHLRSDEHLEKHRDRKRRGGNTIPVNTNGKHAGPSEVVTQAQLAADKVGGW